MMNDEAVEEKQENQLIAVDARVAVDGGHVHHYDGITPIKNDLDNEVDWLFLYRDGESIASYRPGFWKAVETFSPRPIWQWREGRRLMSRETVTTLTDEEKIKLKLSLLDETDKAIFNKLKDMDQRLTALHVGFSDLTLHLEPLLRQLIKPEPLPEQVPVKNEWWDRWQRW